MYCIVIYIQYLQSDGNQSTVVSFEFFKDHVDAEILNELKIEAGNRVGGVFDVLVHGIFKL